MKTWLENGPKGCELSEQDKWTNIAWNLPAGQALRSKIEALVAQLKPEQASLQERMREREGVRQAHDKSVALVEEAVAMLSGLESRKDEMDSTLKEVRQQLEDIKKALLKLTKADLDQLRRMPDPPIPIRRTLEMVHLILNSASVSVGQKVDYERQVRRTLSRSDLIPTILNFDVKLLAQNPQVAEAVDQNYLGGTAWTDESSPKGADGNSLGEDDEGNSCKPSGPIAEQLAKKGNGSSDRSSVSSEDHALVRSTATSMPPPEASSSFASSFAQSGGFGGSFGAGATSLGAFFGAPSPKNGTGKASDAKPPGRGGGALPNLRRVPSSSSPASSASSSPSTLSQATSSPPGLKRVTSSSSTSSTSSLSSSPSRSSSVSSPKSPTSPSTAAGVDGRLLQARSSRDAVAVCVCVYASVCACARICVWVCACVFCVRMRCVLGRRRALAALSSSDACFSCWLLSLVSDATWWPTSPLARP